MPTVFLSYSHQDERWKKRVAAALAALGLETELEVWDDRRIAAGDGWLAEIEAAMNRASVAVLLVSTDFLASRFIRGTEVPHLLKRRKEEGLRIIPLFVRPSPWEAVDWLAATQGRPTDAKPLSTLRKAQADHHLADLALEVRACLTAPTASPLSRGGEGGRRERGPGGEVQPRLNLGRLPIASPLLIGRETELARLDAAWESSAIHVLTLVAFGGTGKSALVSHWLDRMSAAGWRGARRVLDWSFYSQGTEDRVTSADRFLDYALDWFGDPDPKAGAARDRGLRLADLIRQEKTLLVLDGVEPLQHPPNHPLAGRLKDPGLAALLKSLAGANPGLCVVTTRERITDLGGFARTAPQEDLESLAPKAGGGGGGVGALTPGPSPGRTPGPPGEGRSLTGGDFAILVHLDERLIHLDASSVQLDEPLIQLDAPAIHLEGHLVHLDAPAIHLEGHLVHLDAPSIHLDGPLVQLDAPSVHLDGPLVHLDASLVHLDGLPVQLTGPSGSPAPSRKTPSPSLPRADARERAPPTLWLEPAGRRRSQ